MATAGQGVYNGLATVGKIQATVGLVVFTCIAMSCCASGVMTIKNDASDKTKPQGAGYALVAAGCFLALCAVLGYWLTTTYKPVAALGGAGGTGQIGQAIF